MFKHTWDVRETVSSRALPNLKVSSFFQVWHVSPKTVNTEEQIRLQNWTVLCTFWHRYGSLEDDRHLASIYTELVVSFMKRFTLIHYETDRWEKRESRTNNHLPLNGYYPSENVWQDVIPGNACVRPQWFRFLYKVILLDRLCINLECYNAWYICIKQRHLLHKNTQCVKSCDRGCFWVRSDEMMRFGTRWAHWRLILLNDRVWPKRHH